MLVNTDTKIKINYSILYQNDEKDNGDDFNTSTLTIFITQFSPSSTIKQNGITLRDKDVVYADSLITLKFIS